MPEKTAPMFGYEILLFGKSRIIGKLGLDWPMKFKNHKMKNGQWHSVNGLKTSYHPYFWIENSLGQFTPDEIERYQDWK